MTAHAAELQSLHWPPALVRPKRPPKLVYLDMNHWIYLSRAASGGKNAAQYEPALNDVVQPVSPGQRSSC